MDSNKFDTQRSKDANRVSPASFKGYTMNELRYERAVTALQMEFCKSKILYNYNKLRKRKFLPSATSSNGSQSWIGKLFSGLQYTDYVLLGFSLYSSAKKVMKFFSHDKSKK